MKLSIFTTVTNAEERGDNWRDAFDCYRELADELVIVDGSRTAMSESDWDGKETIVHHKWPQNFDWPFIGQQFQRGYEAATGDWVIHADVDFIFHQGDFTAIRQAMENNPDAPALSFYKWQFTLPDRYNLKSRLVIAVNKKVYGDRIRFDSGGDLCQPSLDGKYIDPSDVPEARIPIYNYEKLLKTEAQIRDDVTRMARAWHKHFKEPKLGTEDSAYFEWLNMSLGRFKKPQKQIALSDHPKYVQKTIQNLKRSQWGYSGLGHLKEIKYV